jgi:hypothetical protein
LAVSRRGPSFLLPSSFSTGRTNHSVLQDWIHADDASLLYDNPDATSSFSSSAASGKPTALQLDRAELLLRKVAAPTDPAKLGKPCPICKEKFKEEWSEPDEDWVFYNAIDVEGTVRLSASPFRLSSHGLRLRIDDLLVECSSTTLPVTPKQRRPA